MLQGAGSYTLDPEEAASLAALEKKTHC